MLVTNTQRGPRGLNTTTGPVYLAPNEAADVEMSEAEDLILTITERGAGKLSSSHDYPVRGRGGQGR